jgi:hypothetical protein
MEYLFHKRFYRKKSTNFLLFEKEKLQSSRNDFKVFD